MTWTDAQGRPELFVHPDILRGTAEYRIVDDGDSRQEDEQQLRRTPSPIRVAAAAKLAADRAAAADARRAGE